MASIDRVQVGRVFGNKNKDHEVVRITRVWDAYNDLHGLGPLPTVTVEVWDTHETQEVPWDRTTNLLRTTFEERYRYLPEHVLNVQVELEEAQAMLNALARKAASAMGRDSADAIKLVDSLVNMARREAALRIEVHDWDEGCAGVGCCADTPVMAADLIRTDITDDERAELLAEI